MHNQKIKFLIVDDVDVNRAVIKLSLKSDEYEFLEAKDGLEAVEIAKKERPDVILMDAVMPNMNGFEATKAIREINEIERTPVLMITSLDDKNDKIKALDMGVNDFITKPFDKAELKARCKSYAQFSNLNKKYSLATINPITREPNRLALVKDISEKNSSKELFLINVDNIESLENFYGSEIVGDLQIKFVEILKEHFSPLNIEKIYHLTQEKYAVILKSEQLLSDDEVKDFCFNFVEAIKHTQIELKGYHIDLNITMSFSASKESLYEDANEVLRCAINMKKEYLLSSEVIADLKAKLKSNLDMINTIKYALKNDKIAPHFQPLFDNKKKIIYKYESLVRMCDENDNMVYPGPLFLDTAKKGKLYTQVTKVLVEKVIQKIRESGKEFSLNLSSLDIEDPHISAFLLNIIKKNSDITHKLIFELLEDKDTEDYETVKSFILMAKSYGIKIAIDDFGSGYSNFMRIIEFEPDIIKIDGSLIKDIATSKVARNTVEMIKYFADKVGAKTVAEFVENQEIYEIVNEIGIDFSQGYFVGKAQKELRESIEILEELEV